MVILDLIFGFLLLFAGRNLFWLCVGIVGFLFGVQCAGCLGLSSGPVMLAAALICGIVGAVLAVSFEWAAVVIGAGFVGGGYLLMGLVAPGVRDPYSWLIFLAGGIIGMCLMVVAFDWTLIIISSLVGATLIVQTLHGHQTAGSLLFFVCLGMGVLVQSLGLKGLPGQPSERRA